MAGGFFALLDDVASILDDVSTDPFGNPVPPQTAEHPRPSADEVSAERLASRETTTAVVSRIGEPIAPHARIKQHRIKQDVDLVDEVLLGDFFVIIFHLLPLKFEFFSRSDPRFAPLRLRTSSRP